MPKRKPRNVRNGWFTIAGLVLYKQVGGVRLGISIMSGPDDGDGEWIAIALEHPVDKDVLEQHAHKSLGKFQGMMEAIAAAEAYAASWSPTVEACPCDEIPARRARPSRGRLSHLPRSTRARA
jgi:hypothetical protein